VDSNLLSQGKSTDPSVRSLAEVDAARGARMSDYDKYQPLNHQSNDSSDALHQWAKFATQSIHNDCGCVMMIVIPVRTMHAPPIS
jgi:hypothetical protein